MRGKRASALPPLAYASVGQSGDFGGKKKDTEDKFETWTFTCGLGWLYGLGLCIGPFFGTGVGLTFPGGVIAGAGGGIGVVFGIGMGSGVVWGSGRGNVQGFGVVPPMQPPFAEGGIPRPSDLPSFAEVGRRATEQLEMWRAQAARKARERRAVRSSKGGLPPLGFAARMPPPPLPGATATKPSARPLPRRSKLQKVGTPSLWMSDRGC